MNDDIDPERQREVTDKGLVKDEEQISIRAQRAIAATRLPECVLSAAIRHLEE